MSVLHQFHTIEKSLILYSSPHGLSCSCAGTLDVGSGVHRVGSDGHHVGSGVHHVGSGAGHVLVFLMSLHCCGHSCVCRGQQMGQGRQGA